jgi:hypothetical protein
MDAPHDFTKGQLKKVKVSALRVLPLLLRCDQCRTTWQVSKKGLRLPKGYWRCPKGCNKSK